MTEKPRETQAESHVVELKEKVNNSSLMKHLPRAPTLGRLVGEQRQQARDHTVDRVAKSVSGEMASHLDTLLVVRDGESVSPLHAIKSNPGHPSVESMRVAVRKLGLIEETGVLDLDLSWLSF